MTLKEIESMDALTLTPAQVASVLNCDPQVVRILSSSHLLKYSSIEALKSLKVRFSFWLAMYYTSLFIYYSVLLAFIVKGVSR